VTAAEVATAEVVMAKAGPTEEAVAVHRYLELGGNFLILPKSMDRTRMKNCLDVSCARFRAKALL